jgi:threonine aldolase
MMPVETNIIIFEVTAPYTAKAVVEKLAQNQVMAFDISPTQVRMVTHLDITREMVGCLIKLVEEL